MDVDLVTEIGNKPSFDEVEPEDCGDLGAPAQKRSKLLNPESGLTDCNIGWAAILADIYSGKSNFGRYMKSTQFRKMPIAYRVARYLRTLCSDLKAIHAGEHGEYYSEWRTGPVKELKPNLVQAMDKANRCLAIGVWGHVWQRMRSFYPAFMAAGVIDIAHMRLEWLRSLPKTADGTLVQPEPAVTLGFVGEPTWAAVQMYCELAETSFTRFRIQLRSIIQWAHGQWEVSDGTECTKNLFRWLRSEKVSGYLLDSGHADFMTYAEFVGALKVSNAGVEGRFSEYTARKNASTTSAHDSRCGGMIVTKQLPEFGPGPGTTPFTTRVDGLAYLKEDLPF